MKQEGCGRKIGDFRCCSVVCGDCLELMARLPAGCVDAVITDPPYGKGAYNDSLALTASTLPSAFFGYPEELVRWCVQYKLHPSEWVVWFPTNKPIARVGPARLPRSSEHIAIFGLIRDAMLMRERSPDKFCRKKARLRGNSEEVCRIEDVWRDPAPGCGFNANLRLHVNEKPILVLERLVRLTSIEGTTILDPFLGSGTTAVAALKLGRHFLGFEIEPRYVEIARERIALVQAQPRLFDAPQPEQLTL